MKTPVLRALGVLLANMIITQASAALTPALLAQSEPVIEHCERLYEQVWEQRKRLVKSVLKYQKGLFTRFINRNDPLYKKRLLHLTTFDEHFYQFTQITKDKNKIRSAHSVKEFARNLESYSSNCIRFSRGLLGFVDWSFGQGPAGFDQIYCDWVKNCGPGTKRSHPK